jgi:hypothetical protein
MATSARRRIRGNVYNSLNQSDNVCLTNSYQLSDDVRGRRSLNRGDLKQSYAGPNTQVNIQAESIEGLHENQSAFVTTTSDYMSNRCGGYGHTEGHLDGTDEIGSGGFSEKALYNSNNVENDSLLLHGNNMEQSHRLHAKGFDSVDVGVPSYSSGKVKLPTTAQKVLLQTMARSLSSMATQ